MAWWVSDVFLIPKHEKRDGGKLSVTAQCSIFNVLPNTGLPAGRSSGSWALQSITFVSLKIDISCSVLTWIIGRDTGQSVPPLFRWLAVGTTEQTVKEKLPLFIPPPEHSDQCCPQNIFAICPSFLSHHQPLLSIYIYVLSGQKLMSQSSDWEIWWIWLQPSPFMPIILLLPFLDIVLSCHN